MMRRSGRLALIALLALSGGASFAQAPASSAKPKDEPKAAAPAKPDAAQPAPEGGVNTIDQILEGEEDILQGTGYTYDPGSRRDPFKSLLVTQDKTKVTGPRPPDIPGC